MVEYITIPTYFTLIRLCAAPLILPIFFVALLPYNNIVINTFLAILFALFSFTDFLDGFLARYYHQETALGKTLDPIADKFLIFSSLIGLLVAQKIFFLWVLIFIGRDLFMMGLRQIALQYTVQVPVSVWGKVRTCVLMMYITFLIITPYKAYSWAEASWWHSIETILLVASLFLTIWSAKEYMHFFLATYIPKLKE